MHRPNSHRRRTRPWGKVCSLVVLLALVLRVLYVPYHLAQDDHVGTAGHALSHVSVELGHVHHEHHASHAQAHDEHAQKHHEGHDDEHVPHPTIDHAAELIAQRGPSRGVGVELAVLPVEARALSASHVCRVAAGPDPRPPESRRALAVRPRGPPAAV